MERKENKDNKDEKWKGKIERKKTKNFIYQKKKILNKNSLSRSNPISMQGGDENKWIDKDKN